MLRNYLNRIFGSDQPSINERKERFEELRDEANALQKKVEQYNEEFGKDNNLAGLFLILNHRSLTEEGIKGGSMHIKVNSDLSPELSILGQIIGPIERGMTDWSRTCGKVEHWATMERIRKDLKEKAEAAADE